MTSKELAIAIDTKRLAGFGSGSLNPFICSVPTGLKAQRILELIYEQAIEESLEDGLDEEAAFPFRYDYLWHGSLGKYGAVNGCECTQEYGSIKPPDEAKVRRILAKVKNKLADKRSGVSRS
jgi:hypothetical protein